MSHIQDENPSNRTGERSGTKGRPRLQLTNIFQKCIQDTRKNDLRGPTPNFNDSDADALNKSSVSYKKKLYIKNSSDTKNKSDWDLNNDQLGKNSFIEESNDCWRSKQLNRSCKNQNFNDCIYSSNSLSDRDNTYSSELHLENSNSYNWENKFPECIVQTTAFHRPFNHSRGIASGDTYHLRRKTYSGNCRTVESKNRSSEIYPHDSDTDINLNSRHSLDLHVERFPKCNLNVADEGGSDSILRPYAKCDNLTDISKQNKFRNRISSSGGECIYSDDVFTKGWTDKETAVNNHLEEDGRHQGKSNINLYNPSKGNQQQIDSITEVLSSVRDKQGTRNYGDLPRINDYFSKLVGKFLPGCSSRLYGSYLGGYAVLSSYVDFELIISTSHCSDKQVLNELAKFLNKENPDYDATCEEVYKNSKKTKLMFFDTKYDYTCVVQILSKRNTAYKTSCLMQHILNLDDRIRTLVIAARYWAEVCGILKEEFQHNRLHPICIALLVIHFLQQHDPPVLEFINVKVSSVAKLVGVNKESIAELWLAFLKYYSMTFNWKDDVVNIRSKEPILKSSKSWREHNWIGIEDPYNEDNNVAKSITSQEISHYLQMCFTRTYQYFSLPSSSEDFSDDGFCDDFNDDSSRCSKIGGSSSAKNGSLQYNYEFYISNFTDGSDNAIFCSFCDNKGAPCEKKKD